MTTKPATCAECKGEIHAEIAMSGSESFIVAFCKCPGGTTEEGPFRSVAEAKRRLPSVRRRFRVEVGANG